MEVALYLPLTGITRTKAIGELYSVESNKRQAHLEKQKMKGIF